MKNKSESPTNMFEECNQRKITTTEKRCYTVEDLQNILGCGREAVYNLLNEKAFRWIRLGNGKGPYRIPRESFDQWLESGQ